MAIVTWIATLALAQPAPEAPQPAPIPMWIEPPTITASDYPFAALQAGLAGTAILRCQASLEGVPSDCVVLSEDPPGYDFGVAAIPVIERARMNPDFVAAVEQPATFRLRVPFALIVSNPTIVISGHETGAATVQCRLSEVSLATDCATLSETPEGTGLGAQAINVLTSGGLPPGLIPNATPGQQITVQFLFGPQ